MIAIAQSRSVLFRYQCGPSEEVWAAESAIVIVGVKRAVAAKPVVVVIRVTATAATTAIVNKQLVEDIDDDTDKDVGTETCVHGVYLCELERLHLPNVTTV